MLKFHYNWVKSYTFVKIYKFITKDSEINASPLCLGNTSTEFSVDNTKKTGLFGYVYDFSVDYDTVDIDNILDIYKYLMKKNNIKQCFNIKQVFITLLSLS